MTQDALAVLVAKDEIRELAMLYSRGVDRKDPELLRGLYTDDGVDLHGDHFRGPASEYVDWLAERMPYMPYSGHHICNHMISVNGDEAEGEVYCIAWHVIPNREGGHVEDIQLVRYVDRYRKVDGRWKFALRDVMFDVVARTPCAAPLNPDKPILEDASYANLVSRLFARGARA